MLVAVSATDQLSSVPLLAQQSPVSVELLLRVAMEDLLRREKCEQRCLATRSLLMLILSMWASWQLFFGPGTEQLTYGIIAPSASWAVMVSFAEKRARWLTVTAWAMLALLPSGDIEKAVLPFFPPERSCCRWRGVVRGVARLARTRNIR